MKHNKYNRIFNFRNLMFLACPFLLLMKVPLEQKISLEIIFWLYLIVTIGFVILLIRSIRKIDRLQKMVSLVMISITLLIVNFNLSTKLFLGEKIAEEYVAESPGYCELKVYEKSCTFSYGGIFGMKDINYYNYEVGGDYFWILASNRLIELNFKNIHINGKQLEVKTKAK